MRKSRLFAAIMLVLTCGLLLPASPRGGTLKGAVLSGKGVPVKSAQVYWESADGTNPHILHTGSNGAFQIMVQRDGLYDLRAESGGMWSEWKRNVIVRGGADVNIDLRLSRSQPPASSRAAGRDADNGKSRE